MTTMTKSTLAIFIHAALFSASASYSVSAIAAEDQAEQKSDNQLEVIQVTARKRVENAQEVPLSVSALQGDNLDAYSSAGMDIRFMNAKIPSLSVESSFGRTFPRFYVRGLGNTDFDLNASQPVSLVVDEIVQENPILKGFPVFDISRVEVLRGPQGTLFGRNTPAGLVKFDSVKPGQDFDGYGSVSYGSKGAFDFEGAVGGGLTDNLSSRISLLHQEKDDYIDNLAPGFEQNDVLGGYKDQAARIQFLYEQGDFSALLNYHYRDLDGKPIVFHANLVDPGTNNISASFDSDVVYHDAANMATQQVTSKGSSLKMEYDFSNHTLTSITGWESAEIFSRADVDGGYGAGFGGIANGPREGLLGQDLAVPFSAESADGIPDHDQVTQEIRLSSNLDGKLNYQIGAFYFAEDLVIESFSYDTLAGGTLNGYAKQYQETRAWAVFTSVDYALTDAFKVTAGMRYSEDEKEFTASRFIGPFGTGQKTGTANPEDNHVSWDLSTTYKITDEVNVYARLANGFRAPSVQGRILFGDEVTVAESETIDSMEIGIKTDVLEGRGRINASIYSFSMDDQQLTAVGGEANFNRLINAEETIGYGFELDSQWLLTPDLIATFNVSFNKTELKDTGLSVATCMQCTVTDPKNASGQAYIDGNSLPHSPEWIYNFTLRYAKEMGEGEFFAYTDWSYRSEIDFFLYEAREFKGESLLEGGLRVGYQWASGDNEYEVAGFARNLTDEQVVIGGVDFNNNTGIINEGRFVGAEFKIKFF